MSLFSSHSSSSSLIFHYGKKAGGKWIWEPRSRGDEDDEEEEVPLSGPEAGEVGVCTVP